MKQISIAALLGLIIGCGGGGGGAAPPGGGNPTDAQLAQQVIEACGLDSINQLLELLALLENTVDPGGQLPTFNVLAIDVPAARIDWDLDTDNDELPDMFGSFRLDDGQGGVPAVDLTPILQQGLQGLQTVLAGLPDGSLFIMELNMPSPLGNTIGLTSVAFTGGTANTASGQVDIQNATCQVVFTFMDLPVASIFSGGGIPTAVVDLQMTGNDGLLEGTISFDGSNTAQIDVTFNGADAFSFTIDLTTGQVTLI